MNELKSLNKDFLVMSSIIKNQSTCHILTSKGLNLSQRFVKIGWMCGFSYNTEGNFLTIYDYRNESNFTGFDDLLKKVKGDYLVCQNNETVKSGKYRVLFSPRAFMHMMMVFSSCLSGFAVAKKISPWAGKIDEKLFDERVSIISDLVSANSSFRKAVDDEGTPTGRLTLIDKGILKSFYHSRDTAFQCGQSPTGHAYRARYLAMPLPSLDGTILASGTADTEEMKTKAEIWVDDLMGTMTSNPYSGIISGNIAMGYVMENGKRRARIKDAMLSINIFDAFRNSIIAISKESQRYGYPGFASVYDAPWLLFDGIPVSA
jgi:PmbA protein